MYIIIKKKNYLEHLWLPKNHSHFGAICHWKWARKGPFQVIKKIQIWAPRPFSTCDFALHVSSSCPPPSPPPSFHPFAIFLLLLREKGSFALSRRFNWEEITTLRVGLWPEISFSQHCLTPSHQYVAETFIYPTQNPSCCCRRRPSSIRLFIDPMPRFSIRLSLLSPPLQLQLRCLLDPNPITSPSVFICAYYWFMWFVFFFRFCSGGCCEEAGWRCNADSDRARAWGASSWAWGSNFFVWFQLFN